MVSRHLFTVLAGRVLLLGRSWGESAIELWGNVTGLFDDKRVSYSIAASVTLGLLFFVVTAGTFSSLGVVLPAMIKDLGWSWTQAGLGFTLLAVVCGLEQAPRFPTRQGFP